MTIVKKAVITAIANEADAIAMSVIGGVPQCAFTARATTNSTGGGALPTHCWANGQMEDTLVALYLADSRFTVLDAADRNRPAATVLLEHSPPLYPWTAPQ